MRVGVIPIAASVLTSSGSIPHASGGDPGSRFFIGTSN